MPVRASRLASNGLRGAFRYTTIGAWQRTVQRLTIAEAATLLGVHKNTVRNRIKDGTYKAEKVITERGPTYIIERESLLTNLTTNTLSVSSQELVSPQAMAFVQELLRPFVSELGEVREQLGTERARRQMAEERVAELEAKLEAFEASQTPPEASEGAEPRSATGEARAAQEGPFTEEEHDPTLRVGQDSPTPPERRSLWQWIFGSGS